MMQMDKSNKMRNKNKHLHRYGQNNLNIIITLYIYLKKMQRGQHSVRQNAIDFCTSSLDGSIENPSHRYDKIGKCRFDGDIAFTN